LGAVEAVAGKPRYEHTQRRDLSELKDIGVDVDDAIKRLRVPPT
jgi:hypothetical protein